MKAPSTPTATPAATRASARSQRARNLCIERRLLPLPEGGEQDHVADRLLAAEHHREPVDAHAESAGRRHPVRERLDVVLVELLATHLAHLPEEPFSLLLGVVDLGESVAEFDPTDKEFKALDDV